MSARSLSLSVFCLFLLSTACVDDQPTAPVAANLSAPDSREIPDEYLVVLKSTAGDPASLANTVATANAGEVKTVWRNALKGFAIRLPSSAAAKELANHPDVLSVEPNMRLTVQADTQYVGASSGLWGLDRVDQRPGTLNGYHYNYFGASNIHIYIIDTGIYEHSDLDGRVGSGWGIEGETEDCYGHGTAVASIAAGETFGIARSATVHPINVSDDCAGNVDTDDLVDGIEWVTSNHETLSVANISISNSAGSTAIDNAVSGLISSGVFVVVAAGNNNTNACTASPARVSAAFTVAASNNSDARWSSSNYGSCVDLFAPGEAVQSAWLDSTSTNNGTSLATPFVTGTVAMLWSQEYYASQAFINLVLTSTATPDSLSSIGSGSPNLLLYALHTYSYMDGPVSITTASNNTWTAQRWGGSGTYSYLWEQKYDGSSYSTVGTAQTYQQYLDTGECTNFFIRVTIDSGDEVKVHTKYVQPVIEPCPEQPSS